MISLQVDVYRKFRNFTVDVKFEAPMPGVVALFGPSGAGKSTILAAISGIARPGRKVPSNASVMLGALALDKIPVRHRGIGMVFQDGRLFPHMRVRDNLLFGFRRGPKGAITLESVVELLDIGHLLKRWPHNLSGGERQRVAIGRALLCQPTMLLMDEPLAALDAARRDEILPYLSILRNEMRLPIVYASHSLDEVMRLADTVVLLEKGGVLACGPVSEIAARADLPLAARPDAGGVLHGYVASHNPDRGLTTIASGGQAVLVPMVDAPVGLNVRVRIPAREVILSLDLPRNISVNNVFAVTILSLGQAPERHAALVELDMGGGTLLAHLTQDAAKRLELRVGDSLYALIKSMSVELLPE